MTNNKIIATFFLALLITAVASAQAPQHRCGTMQYYEEQKLQDHGLESRMAIQEQQLQQNLASGRFSLAGVMSAPIVLRVVVHVVWNTPVQNISDTQILSQIDVLNEDFNRNNADATNTPSVFAPLAANTGIHFCLANVDPAGNPTNGINRVQTSVTSFSTNNNVKFTAQGGADAWDPNTYLNIWVCNLSGGLLGYAQYPGGVLSTSGAVFLYNAFGRTGTLLAPYNLGRNATHELGHMFNLRHIWGDANCGNDFVSDTPVQQQANFGCPVFPHISCTNGPNGDMFMNYMDYSDDACLNMFTSGQSARMNASINMSYPGLISNLDCVELPQTVYGKVYYDTNQNSVNDVGEPPVINRQILLLPDSAILFTNAAGNFFGYVDSGSYSLQMPPVQFWTATQGSSGYNIVVDTADVCCNDFGIFPTTIIDSVSICYTAAPYRCGFDIPAWINLINDGTSIVDGIIRYVPDDSMQFVSASPIPDNISGDTLYFNYNNLFPGQTFTVHLVYEMPLTPGLILCSNTYADVFDGVSIQPFTENQYCDTITCSWDPNDKKVFPPGVQAQHYILKTDTLLYTIRFQNEGNDTAFTVVLRDTLSALLDRNSIELAGWSHPVSFTVSSNNVAEFRFENIMLPYKAIDETGSNGFVTFRIRPFTGLPDGTVINNEAGIYFDFNPPVITNNTFVTLTTTIPLGINEIDGIETIIISPQPFTNHCSVMIDSEDVSKMEYQVYDVTGRIITSGVTAAGTRKLIQLDTSVWNKGFYFIRISNQNGTNSQTARLLKQ